MATRARHSQSILALGGDFGIGLDVDMFVGFQTMNCILGEFHPSNHPL